MKLYKILFILVLLIFCNSLFSENTELTAVIKQEDKSQAKLYRYSFTNKAGNKVYFEFHYDDKIKGMDRTNPLHVIQIFILFDLCKFWNYYVGGEFNLGSYLDNKALFDAIHFAPYRINSISFHEIIGEEDILVLQYSLNYLNHSILGPYVIAGMDTKISGSKTYNHWPGGFSGYKITYPDSPNEIHINIIRGMGGADFGSYYIGLLANTHSVIPRIIHMCPGFPLKKHLVFV